MSFYMNIIYIAEPSVNGKFQIGSACSEFLFWSMAYTYHQYEVSQPRWLRGLVRSRVHSL